MDMSLAVSVLASHQSVWELEQFKGCMASSFLWGYLVRYLKRGKKSQVLW